LRSLKTKILLTVSNFRKTAYHHYGNNHSSIIKFIYYSLINVNTFIVVGIDLDGELPAYNLEEGFEVIKPTIEELDKLRGGKDLPREFYYDQIHGIKNCFIALYENEVAYIHWIYVKGDPNRFLILSDGVAELNYNTALPKFRGKRLQSKMLGYIFEDLRKRGFKEAVGVINEKNPPAIKGAKRAGMEEIGRIRTLGPFNRKFRV